MATLHKPAEYKAIALWGQNLRSQDYYIQAQQKRASRDRAPVDSVFFNEALGRWMYIRDLQPSHPVRVAYEKAQVVT